jgi:hypothetical protein
MSLRCTARIGSSLSLYGMVKMRDTLSALDASNFGSAFSLRSI